MARATVTQFRPRYSDAIATESHMEAAEAARRILAFAEAELRTSFETGDLNRLRTLQRVHHDATVIREEHRRQAAWADSRCADGLVTAGHGRAA